MPTFTGTAGNDPMTGSAGADILIGLAGDDTYTVNNFADEVVETFGGGIDTIRTSVLGSLSIYSLARWAFVENLTYTGLLASQLQGNALDNVIKANSAATVNDTLYGGAGSDSLYGYGGDDLLMGGTGNDYLDGGTGADNLVGGQGDDTFIIDSLSDRAYEYVNGGIDTIRSGVAKDLRLAWTQQIENLTYTGSTAASLYGNDLGNTIKSISASNEFLYGFGGNDVLDGGTGNDTMIGGTGDDTYYVSTTDVVRELVGEGTDTFVGAKTDIGVVDYATTIENIFYTGTTAASVKGNALDNIVSGGSGNDSVSGLDGKDTLVGGAGADTLFGGNGDDFMYGGGLGGLTANSGYVPDASIDTLAGGAGNDRYRIDSSLDVVTEFTTGGTLDVVVTAIDNALSRYANVEALVLEEGSAAFYGEGSTGNDILIGNRGDNFLSSGAGNDTLSGQSGLSSSFTNSSSDVLDAGAGNDVLVAFDYNSGSFRQETTMFGGSGDDFYVLGDDIDTYGGSDTGGVDTAVMLTTGSIRNLDGVENVFLYGTGGPEDARARAALDLVYQATHNGDSYTGYLGFAANATGNDLGNRIVGNTYDNVLSGMGGADTLIGGAGDDTLDGGTGVDRLEGGVGDDRYVVTTGDVVVEAAGQGFDIVSSASLLTLAAYANIEGIEYTGSANVTMNNGIGNITNDWFTSGSGNDTLSGFGGNDELHGGAGNDTLSGGDGADKAYGDAGNDTITGDAGNDQLYGGDGNDTIDGGADNDTIYGEAGSDTLLGNDGNDQIYGGTSFSVDTSANTLRGGNGSDSLYGNAGIDTIDGDTGNDSLYGGDANDVLRGGDGNDYVYGQGGNDLIQGGSVTNSGVYYVSGGDVLWGGYYGADGLDADTFRFDAPTAANKAVETFPSSGTFYFNTGSLIADFNPAVDLIQFAASSVGDNDTLLENVAIKTTAGGTFSAASEMTIFRTDVAATFSYSNSQLTYFDAAAVTAVIGNASTAFAAGSERMFVVDDGTSSAIFQFVSSAADAVVSTSELSLVSVVYNNTEMVASDFALV